MKLVALRSILSVSCVALCATAPMEDENSVAPVSVAGKHLHFVTIFKLNFFKAEHYCLTLHMRLVAVDSQEVDDAIVKYVKDNGLEDKSFWTSGNDLGKEGEFYWLANGKRMSYTNWARGEPNHFFRAGQREHCVLLWTKTHHKWNDGHCHVPENFICEFYD